MIQQSALLVSVLLIGGLLGLLYFGGLWYTLRRLQKTRQPIRLFCWSYLIRLGAVLGVFHLILQWMPPERLLLPLLVCFLGFLFARTWLILRLSFGKHLDRNAGAL